MSNTASSSEAAAAVPDNQEEELLVRIIAPANLQAGFQFEATTPDGRAFLVTVPAGGVKAGQEFDVPMPTEQEELEQQQEIVANAYPAEAAISNNDHNHHPSAQAITPMSLDVAMMRSPQPLEVFMDAPDPTGGPRGKFRNGLLSCCETFPKCTFWCGCCCAMVQASQLATRLNLDWTGHETTPEKARRTLLIVCLIFFLFHAISGIGGEWPWYIQFYILLPFYLYNCWFLYRIRVVMRQRYDIAPMHPTTCQHIGQYLLMIPCCCCASIQMVRHTHDGEKYPYDGFAPDGLPLYSPAIDVLHSDD